MEKAGGAGEFEKAIVRKVMMLERSDGLKTIALTPS